MSYKRFVSMNIAIIGSGEVAAMYASGFACAGHEVFIATKDGDKINFGCQSFDNVHPTNIEDAATIADLIIIATEPKDVREVSYWLGDVRRKVIIDASSNVLIPNEEPIKTVCAIKAITGSQHIVKAFNTTGYEQLLKPIFKIDKAQLILMGDSKKAKEIAKILAIELEIDYCYDFGGSENMLLFNEMTRSFRNLAHKNLIATPVKVNYL